MLRFINLRLAISAYTLFMIEQKNNAKLKGLRISERGKMTSNMYKALSPQDRELLLKRAAAHPPLKRSAKTIKTSADKKDPKKPRKATAYTIFVKENMNKFDKLPHRDRMKAVARLWKQEKQRVSP
ncbi:unnamed protein product [Phytomonas sp. Hart1]|nr:unnamed protein product [Phytomonas sp. Hart1]|eukprot:CCW70003.1 unnamed protein product [Phytomonas sp. isolate Hart1]